MAAPYSHPYYNVLPHQPMSLQPQYHYPQPAAQLSNSTPANFLDGMQSFSDDERADDDYQGGASEDDGDDSDDEYIDDGPAASPEYNVFSTPAAHPPPIPTHSRPPSTQAPRPPTQQQLPIPTIRVRGGLHHKALILPKENTAPKSRPRQPRKHPITVAPMIASTRPSNINRPGQAAHRATLSVSSSTGLAHEADPSIPDPNDPNLIFVGAAQALQMRFLDFEEHMFLDRKTFTDPLYPNTLEPPSRVTPMRCLCCRKAYNGPNARSMWRRHVTHKHTFTLGGKKGNGKGRKRNADDEEGIFGEGSSARKPRKISKKDLSESPAMGDTAQPLLVLNYNMPAFQPMISPTIVPSSQTIDAMYPASEQQHATPWDNMPITALQHAEVDLESPPSSDPDQREAGQEQSDSESESDAPLSQAVQVQKQPMLAPSLSIDSPAKQALPAKLVVMGPKLVQDEEQYHHASRDGLRAPFAGFAGNGADDEEEFSYGGFAFTSPIIPSKVNSFSGLGHGRTSTFGASNGFADHFGPNFGGLMGSGGPGTPGRSKAEFEQRLRILAQDSPTSMSSLGRSLSSSGLPRLPMGSGLTPGRSPFPRSITMPSFATAGSAIPPLDDHDFLALHSSPFRGSSMDFPSPFRGLRSPPARLTALSEVISPVKRKRTATTDFTTPNPFSSNTFNINTKDAFDFFDEEEWLVKSPASGRGDAENDARAALVGGQDEDGRKAKRVKLGI